MSECQIGYPPYCDVCGHGQSWHHANGKFEGKILTCYGIACKCTKRFDDKLGDK